ncbi:hypothetical protein [Pseudomonas tolaasii]
MTYGLTFTNSADVVTLDSEFSRLVVLYSARYGENGVKGAAFPTPITSLEPPLIFARPDVSGGFQWVRLLGGPGNWTGFVNEAAGVGNYFLAAYESKPTAGYGLRLWNGNSKLLFDNGTPCAQFTSVVTTWTFVSAENPSPGRWLYTYLAPASFNTGDYMLINNIAYDLPGNDTFSKLSCGFNYAANTVSVYLQNIGDFRTDSLFLPLLFAKPMPQ